MKRILFILLTALSLLPSFCNADSWTRKTDFPGGARQGSFAFVIGNNAYVGGGYIVLGSGINDLWEYNSASDTWTPRSNPPGTVNNSIYWQRGFTIGNYGYVLTDSNQLWQYAPLTDSWTRKADLPGTYRIAASHFVIGSKAYVGGGGLLISLTKDSSFYCYDPATNTWTGIASAPFSFFSASGFCANNKGYITGIWTGTTSIPKVLRYDPVVNSWSLKADFPDTARTDAATFNIGNIAYFGVGDTATGGYFKDLWQYNAYTDSWTKKTSIPCVNGKDENATLVVNDKGYICFGSDNNPNAEVWEYTPDSVTTVEEITTRFQTDLYPNPATAKLSISSHDKITTIAITNFLSQTLYTHEYNTEKVQVDVTNLPTGVYFIKINGTEVRNFVKK